MTQFQNERMIAAYNAVGAMTDALERTGEYLRERQAFGEPLVDQPVLAVPPGRAAPPSSTCSRHYNYACAEAYLRGDDTSRFATIAKLKAGRLQREVADWCLQFHGGIGYMEETWTARFFRDARLLSIGGGADEVMLRTLARMDDLGSG